VFLAFPVEVIAPYGGVKLNLEPSCRRHDDFWGGELVVSGGDSVAFVAETHRDPAAQLLVSLADVDDNGVEWVTLDEHAGGMLLSATAQMLSDLDRVLACELETYESMLTDDDPYWRSIGEQAVACWDERVASARSIRADQAAQLREFLTRMAGRTVVVAYQ
jgi:hypothetical protein